CRPMRRIISDHFLLNWHKATKVPISRRAGPRRDGNATSPGPRKRGFPGHLLLITSALRRPKPAEWKDIMDFVDSFKCLRPLKVGSKTYAYFSLPAAEKNGLKGISRLPFSLKVLLENLLRNEDGRSVTKQDIQAVAQWLKDRTSDREIA